MADRCNTMWSGDAVTITLTIRNCQTNAIIDLSSATAQYIVIQGPTDNTRIQQNSAFPAGEDGTQGRITTTFAAGLVRALKTWEGQGHVTLASGAKHTSKITFEVEEPL
jgi:hypothetical protein